MNTFETLREAIGKRMQITAEYQGHHREMCPHVLGTDEEGNQRCLFFQFGGYTGDGPIAAAGEWKCMDVAKLARVQSREGQWHSGPPSHQRPSACVKQVAAEVDR